MVKRQRRVNTVNVMRDIPGYPMAILEHTGKKTPKKTVHIRNVRHHTVLPLNSDLCTVQLGAQRIALRVNFIVERQRLLFLVPETNYYLLYQEWTCSTIIK